jgi:hypothetical protein
MLYFQDIYRDIDLAELFMWQILQNTKLNVLFQRQINNKKKHIFADIVIVLKDSNGRL